MTQYVIAGEVTNSSLSQGLPYSLVASLGLGVGQSVNLTLSTQDEATLISAGVLAFPAAAGSVTYLAPKPSGGDDTAQLTSLINSLPTDPYGLGMPVGQIVLQPGTYRFGASAEIPNLGSWVSLIGPGKNLCTLSYYGSGRCLYAHNTHKPVGTPGFIGVEGYGPVLDGFTIDGTHAGAGAIGLDYGDQQSGKVGNDILIQNFTGVGSFGLMLCNDWWWCEKIQFDYPSLVNNTTAVSIGGRASAHSGGTSFGYNVFGFSIEAFSGQDMFLLGSASYAPNVYNGRFSLRGNMQLGSSTACALRLVSGSLNAMDWDLKSETNGSGAQPQTINFAGGTVGSGTGTIIFGSMAASNYVAANSTPTSPPFNFQGVLSGDSSLNPNTGTLQRGMWLPVNRCRVDAKGYYDATAHTFYLNQGNYFDMGVLTANVSPSFTNQFVGPYTCVIRAQQAAAGGPFTITWPSNATSKVLWPGGTAPTMSTGANAVDTYTLRSVPGTSSPTVYVGQSLQNVS